MTNKRIKTGVRLRDVATAAGVSSATVSAVVNGRAEKYGICQATQVKVQGLIRQMGYSPSLAALDMAAGRNSLVGLAVSSDFPAADRLMASLEPALAQSGFRLVVAYLPPDPQVASTRITSLLQFGIAVLVVCPAESLPLPKITCPAIVVGRPGAGLPAVYEDEAEGGRRLARCLLDKGHRRLAILGAPGSTLSATSGFLEACTQGGATVRSFNAVTEFLPVSGSVTAVFCGSSAMLLELYSRGLSAGLRLGVDLAVVAVDRLGVAAYLVPRPTVLKPGGSQLGQAAARLILQAIEGAVPGDLRLEPVLVDGDIMPAISPDKAKPQSGISMEGGAPSPPAPKPANPVFEVSSTVSTGDTEPRSPGTSTSGTSASDTSASDTPADKPNATFPEPDVTPPTVLNPESAIPELAPLAPLETPSETLQMPETASDVLSAPNSPLPATPPDSEISKVVTPTPVSESPLVEETQTPAFIYPDTPASVSEPASPDSDLPAAAPEPRSPGTANATFPEPDVTPSPAVNPDLVMPDPVPPAPLETLSEALQTPEPASGVLGTPSSPLPATPPSNSTTDALDPEPESVPAEVPPAVTMPVS